MRTSLIAAACTLALFAQGGWSAPAGLVSQPPAAPAAKDQGQGFPDIVGALKATPGCLGVETAKTDSGKLVIFAWFENKKAALNWYYSDPHKQVMKMVFPDLKPREKPMAGVPDDAGPIMAIASVTPSGPPTKEHPFPPF